MPVRQTPLVVQVFEQFRDLIDAGEWPVGSKIPTEMELAAQLGVSRGTVREALRALSLTGLLEPRVADGTYVRATNELAAMLTRDDAAPPLQQVLDVRAGLEATGSRLAAIYASADAVEGLRTALAIRAEANTSGDLDSYVKADAAFHRAVVKSSGNPMLLRLFDAAAAVLAQSVRDTSSLPENETVTNAHLSVVEAIAMHDPDRADLAARALIASTSPIPGASLSSK